MKKKERDCLLKRETLIHWDQYDTSMEFYLYLAVSKEIIENLKNFKGMSEEYILIPGETEDGAFEFFWTEREYEGFLENLTSIYRPQVKFIKAKIQANMNKCISAEATSILKGKAGLYFLLSPI